MSARLNAQTASRGELVSPQNRARYNAADPAIRELAMPALDAAETVGAPATPTPNTADSARVLVNGGSCGNTSFAVNQGSMAGRNYNASVTIVRAFVTIVSAFGKRSGSVTTNGLDDSSLREAVQLSERLAKLSPEDPEALPEFKPQQYVESLGWTAVTAALDPASRSGAIREVSGAARSGDLVATGYLEPQTGSKSAANSRGLFAYARRTSRVFSTTVRTEDGTGSGWAGGTSHHWTAIDPRALGARATHEAQRSSNPVAIEPGSIRWPRPCSPTRGCRSRRRRGSTMVWQRPLARVWAQRKNVAPMPLSTLRA